jgi:lysophospholipase L1-like esterase
MTVLTDIIARAQQIESLAQEIQNLAGANPPTGLPATLDCLNGTVPSTTNMYSDELNETAWLNKRSAYRTTMKNAASGSIICIGDSMIERNDWSAVSQYCVNLGISGESARQFHYRLNETDINSQPNLIHRAGAVVVLTGVNDLSDTRNGISGSVSTTAGYTNAANTVGPILQKLAGWFTGKGVIVKLVKVDTSIFSVPHNSGIDLVNAYIDTHYGSKSDWAVVDINPTVAPSGSLLSQYHVDGQHLNAAGYAVLNAAVKTALQGLSVIA